MLEFSVKRWVLIGETLLMFMRAGKEIPVIPREQILDSLRRLHHDCEMLGLSVSAAHAERLMKHAVMFREDIEADIHNLERTIVHELETALFLYVPRSRADYYRQSDASNSAIGAKFPSVAHDLEEAGKCLSLARYTACVFHLMRVMEVGVQSLGRRLRVKLTNEKNWQPILDEVNKAIRNLPSKTAAQKVRRARLASISAHLYHVKLAWRNPVMHPKKVRYTEEEARAIYNSVGTFMLDLAGL